MCVCERERDRDRDRERERDRDRNRDRERDSTYEQIHVNVQNSITMMNSQGNTKLLENTVSSHISSKAYLSLILSQKQLFKPSLFVKN